MSSSLVTNRDYLISLNSGANTLSIVGTVAITGNLSVTGNATLSGNILGDRIQNGTTSIDIQTINGNANITVGGVSNVAVFATTGTYVTGVVSAAGNISGNYFVGNGSQLTGVVSSYGNANVAANLAAFGSNPVSTTGNITGGNITVAGNATITGNLNVTGTAGNVATKSSGAWTVPVGNSTQSFTVDSNNTYQMWVAGNIPNGIIVWNALATVTNNNVPVIGQQFAWNYEAGGNLILLTSIPAQIIGTAGAISNAAPAVANTNVFSFGINNASGNTVTVRYGWIKIS